MRLARGFTVIAAVLAAHSAFAGPFSSNVTNDAYYPGVPNGIPTARSNNDGVPDIYHAVNQLLGTGFTDNRGVDPMFREPDAIWSSLTGTVTLIGLTAGNSNTLGVYTGLGTGSGQTDVIGPYSGFGFLGSGTFANPYPAAIIGLPPSASFGWYLRSEAGASSSTFFSEAALNVADSGLDHMMTFDVGQLPDLWIYDDANRNGVLDPGEVASRRLYTFSNPMLLTWEDLHLRSGGVLGDDDYDDMIYLVDARQGTPVPEPGTLLLLAAAGLPVLWRARGTKRL